jgi:hypothetical protein
MIAVVLFVSLTLQSCDESKKVTTEIPLEKAIVINLNDITVEGEISELKSTGLNFFSENFTISRDILTSDVLNYLDRFNSIKSCNATIEITTLNDDGDAVDVTVESFKMETTGSEFLLANYPFTTNVDSILEQLSNFAIQVVTKLFFSETVGITVSGNTNYEPGTKLTVKVTLDDVVLVVDLLD